MATLAQLKTLAKDLGIKGYSSMKKDDLAAAIDAKYREMDGPKRMSKTDRVAAYTAQRNGGRLSFRQNRRIRKNENKLKGDRNAEIMSSLPLDFADSFER